MSHVFISYSRQDQAYARRLADDLRQQGFDVWIDDRIDYGERWWQVVVQAVRDCGAFVVIMSPAAERSEWVEREVLLAQREKKSIFPLLLKGKEFPLLITTQFADVRGDKLPGQDFYDRLRLVITPAQRVGQIETPPRTKHSRPKVRRQQLSLPRSRRVLAAMITVSVLVVAALTIYSQGISSGTAVTIFRDANSLTLYLPDQTLASLDGFEMAVMVDGQPQFHVLSAYLPIGMDNFSPPLCVHLKRQSAREPVPDDCLAAEVFQTALADRAVFWHDGSQAFPIQIYRGNRDLGITISDVPESQIRYPQE